MLKTKMVRIIIDLVYNEFCLGSEVKVVSWCTDIGVIEEVADGLGLLIERTRDGLLKNKIQYVEGAGLIEASG